MKKLKTRYRIVILNVAVTIAFYLSYVAYFYFSLEQDGDLAEAVENIVRSVLYLMNYVWINVLWIGILVYGIIVKKRELIFGGIYSLALSAGLIVLILTN